MKARPARYQKVSIRRVSRASFACDHDVQLRHSEPAGAVRRIGAREPVPERRLELRYIRQPDRADDGHAAFANTTGGSSTCQTTGSMGSTFWADCNDKNQMTETSLNTNQGSGHDADGDVTNDSRNTYTYDAKNRIAGMDGWT